MAIEAGHAAVIRQLMAAVSHVYLLCLPCTV